MSRDGICFQCNATIFIGAGFFLPTRCELSQATTLHPYTGVVRALCRARGGQGGGGGGGGGQGDKGQKNRKTRAGLVSRRHHFSDPKARLSPRGCIRLFSNGSTHCPSSKGVSRCRV